MLASLKLVLKRSPFLVGLVRLWRGLIVMLWEERRRAQKQQMLLKLQTKLTETYLATHPLRKLHIGAGHNQLAGWLNTDLEPAHPDILFLDATTIFPFENQVFDYAFSEHMIEHIPYKDGLFMLQEIYRVLKPGGKVRIATPDIRQIVGLLSDEKSQSQKKYLTWHSTEVLGLYSPELTPLQKFHPEWAIESQHMHQSFPDPSQDSACFVVNNFFRSFGHQFLYDVVTLKAALMSVGFVRVLGLTPGESETEHLRGIESHGKVIGEDKNRFETMVVEAVRPILS